MATTDVSKPSMTIKQMGVLRTDKGPLYDVLRLNTVGCAAIVVDGVEYVNQAMAQPEIDLNGNEEIPAILSPDLAKLAGKTLAVTVKRKIPKSCIIECRKIMQLIHDHHKTEGAVMVLYNTETQQFSVYVPKQTVSGALCSIEPEDSCAPLNQHVVVAASFHSHPFGGSHGFLSGTDHGHADAIPDAPIASFNFSTVPINGTKLYKFGIVEPEFAGIPLEPLQFIEELPELVEVSEADAAKYKDVLDERVKASTWSYLSTSSYTPVYTSGKSSTGMHYTDDDYWDDTEYYARQYRSGEGFSHCGVTGVSPQKVVAQPRTSLQSLLADYYGVSEFEIKPMLRAAQNVVKGKSEIWETCTDKYKQEYAELVEDFLDVLDGNQAEDHFVKKIEDELIPLGQLKSKGKIQAKPFVIACMLAYEYSGAVACSIRKKMLEISGVIEHQGDTEELEELLCGLMGPGTLHSEYREVETEYMKLIKDKLAGEVKPSMYDWDRQVEILDALNLIMTSASDLELDGITQAATALIDKIDALGPDDDTEHQLVFLAVLALYWNGLKEAETAKEFLIRAAAMFDEKETTPVNDDTPNPEQMDLFELGD